MPRNLKTVLTILAISIVILSACSTPTPVPPTQAPVNTGACSMTVQGGNGWTNVLNSLGVNPYGNDLPKVIRNGVEQNPTGNLHEGDLIVLAQKPANCTGSYIAARKVSFGVSDRDLHTLSGFQTAITGDELYSAISSVCQMNRWDHLDSGFNGDITNGGCNFTTVVITARDDGDKMCVAYSSGAEAYDATAKFDLARIKSLAVMMTIAKLSPDEAHSQYCK